jgi:hypothetical protein
MPYIQKPTVYEAVKINDAVRKEPPNWLKDHINAGRLSFEESKVYIKHTRCSQDHENHDTVISYPFSNGDWIVQLDSELITVYSDELFNQSFVEA